MDIFPISGDSQKNSFHYKQVKGDFFNRTMRNFFNNTEGGSILKIGNFTNFAIDHCEETLALKPNTLNIVVIFLWNVPEDLSKVTEEYINIRDEPIIFWFIYLGSQNHEKIHSTDGRKHYLVSEDKKIGII